VLWEVKVKKVIASCLMIFVWFIASVEANVCEYSPGEFSKEIYTHGNSDVRDRLINDYVRCNEHMKTISFNDLDKILKATKFAGPSNIAWNTYLKYRYMEMSFAEFYKVYCKFYDEGKKGEWAVLFIKKRGKGVSSSDLKKLLRNISHNVGVSTHELVLIEWSKAVIGVVDNDEIHQMSKKALNEDTYHIIQRMLKKKGLFSKLFKK
jgi:hypothetical protein